MAGNSFPPNDFSSRRRINGRVDSFNSINELIHPVQSLPTNIHQGRSSSFRGPRRFSDPDDTVNVRRVSDALPPSKIAWQKKLEHSRRASEVLFERKISESSWMSSETQAAVKALAIEEEELDTKTLHRNPESGIPGARKVLTDFHRVIAQEDLELDDFETNRARRHAKDEELEMQDIHQRLCAWAKEQKSTKAKVLGRLREPRATERPSEHELLNLVKYCYPPRCEVKALVYDIYQDHAVEREIDVGSIQSIWEEKPADVVLRWIHCPFGLGLTHSSVEDLFRYAGQMGKPFENAGYQGFPYLETEAVYFRSKEQFERMRDVYVLLSKDKSLIEQLNKSSFAKDHNEDLERDLEWRANHTESSLDFWTLCNSDVPCQLSEKPMSPTRRLGRDKVMGGPLRGLTEVDQDYQKQAIASHPFFKDSVLMASHFRSFHASDGFLLTLSAAKGVDYLDKHFSQHLENPQDFAFKNAKASAIARVMQQFKDSGTLDWHRVTPEWFTVYLITEIGSTPHYNVDGCTAPDLKNAYEGVVGELKRQRYEEWEPQKTIRLVRAFLNCLDELNILLSIYARKKTVFKGLIEDCQRMEFEWQKDKHPPNNENGESCVDRAKWAFKVANENYNYTQAQIQDLTQSLEALFQLRSIEQNERAILAEKLNKAVFVFTGVTIIFLPLSFFTSYFGMNIEGIIGTHKNEKFFWSVCGTVSLVIVLLTLLYAFKSQYMISMKGWGRGALRKTGIKGTGSPV